MKERYVTDTRKGVDEIEGFSFASITLGRLRAGAYPLMVISIAFPYFNHRCDSLMAGKPGGHPTIIMDPMLFFIKGNHNDRDDRPT
jgi:hypothetical protein